MGRLSPLFAFVTFVALVGAACTSNTPSSGSPGGGGGAGDVDGGSIPSGCAALAAAYCTIEAKCDTVDMQINFAGDQAACATRTLFSCPSVTAPGTGNTAPSIAACAAAVVQISDCKTFLTYSVGNDLRLCAPVTGTLALGTSCDDDSQCASGSCGQSTTGGTCGACAATPSATSCLENSNCPTGQLCNASRACVAAGVAGATCDSNDPTQANEPCAPYLYCKGAGGSADGDAGAVTNGQCTALGTAGQSCDSTDPYAECGDGFACADSGQCVQIEFVAPGGACDGVFLVCAGGECVPSAGDSGASVCQAYAADGAKCASDGDCEYDSVCVGTVCAPSFTTCNAE